MSKVVKGITRAVSSVVKGAVNVVKKVAKSPIGKALIVAAAVYFGGAALMGGLGAPAGTGLSGFLSGAAQGVSNAWASLGTAASSAMSGNFSQAGSALSSGFQGQVANVGTSAAVNAAPAAAQNVAAVDAVPKTAIDPSMSQVLTKTGLPNSVPTASGPGVWGSMGDYSKAATIMAGSQLAGGVIQGYGQQQALEEQREYETKQANLARDRYNQNVGVVLWGQPNSGLVRSNMG